MGVNVGKCLAGEFRAFLCSDVLATTLGPMVCNLRVVSRNFSLVPKNLDVVTPLLGGVFLNLFDVKDH